MWNFLVGGLLTGSTIILYDGNPSYPDKNRLWKLAEETKATVFGTSASYISACMKDGIKPGESFDLSSLKSISSTGSLFLQKASSGAMIRLKKTCGLLQ